MKPTKKDIEEAKTAAKKAAKKETKTMADNTNEIWRELGILRQELLNIKKHLIRSLDRLGLTYE